MLYSRSVAKKPHGCCKSKAHPKKILLEEQRLRFLFKNKFSNHNLNSEVWPSQFSRQGQIRNVWYESMKAVAYLFDVKATANQFLKKQNAIFHFYFWFLNEVYYLISGFARSKSTTWIFSFSFSSLAKNCDKKIIFVWNKN